MSNSKKRAPKSWARIVEIKAKLGRKGASTEEIIAIFREKYPEVLRIEKDILTDMGLTIILNAVCNLKWGAGSKVQAELFPGYDVPRTVTLRKLDARGTRNIKKDVDGMTLGELDEYIADHEAPPKQSRRMLEFKRFRDFVKPHGIESSIVRDCWKRAHAQSAAK